MNSIITTCDSVAPYMNKTAEIFQHCVKGVDISNNDVTIVLIKKESASKIEEKACRRYIKELKNLITKKTLSEDDEEA